MKFSKFKRFYNRKAVMFGVSRETQSLLTEWSLANGFDLSKSFSGEEQKPEQFDFHITIICSENEGYIEDKIVKIDPITVELERFEVLGVERKVPVIITSKTQSMLDHRKFFEDFYGLRDNWPSWKTHISLSYNWFGTPQLEDLVLPQFPIILDHISVDKLC